MKQRRPKLISLLLAFVLVAIASTASATNASPPAPAPVQGAPALPFTEHQRVLEVIFVARCAEAHIPHAYKQRGEIVRLLSRYGFDEARFKQALKTRRRAQRFHAEMNARMAQCTPALARELYARQT